MFRAVTPRRTMLQQQSQVAPRLSAPLECATPRANPGINCALGTLLCPCRPSLVTSVPVWGTLTVQVAGGRRQGCVGSLCTFCPSFLLQKQSLYIFRRKEKGRQRFSNQGKQSVCFHFCTSFWEEDRTPPCCLLPTPSLPVAMLSVCILLTSPHHTLTLSSAKRHHICAHILAQ